ncbi:MAG: hypothetical protein AAB956_03240 [Patescibacteria group bacterium]
MEGNAYQGYFREGLATSINQNVFAVGSGRNVQLWDSNTFKLIYTHEFEDGGFVNKLMFSPNGKLLLVSRNVSNYEGRVTLLDVDNRRVVQEYEDFQGAVTTMAISSNSKFLLIGYSGYSTAKMHDISAYTLE